MSHSAPREAATATVAPDTIATATSATAASAVAPVVAHVKSAPSVDRQARGREGEDAAAAFLTTAGYDLVERNWRPAGGEGRTLRGEIDCIAWEGAVLCFIEVKARSGTSHGAPQEAVNRSKQRQISRLANAYISLNDQDDVPCRFDVVEVKLNSSGPPRITHHRNAFDYCP